MQETIFEISDLKTSERTHFVLSQQELADLRKQAGEYPFSPLIVKRIEKKSHGRGYILADQISDLYKIAKEIILEGKRKFSLHGYPTEKTVSATPQHSETFSQVKADNGAKESRSLFICQYHNPIHDLERLTSHILTKRMIPLLWNNAAGFETAHLSRQFPLYADAEASNLKDPRQALRFIINNSRNRTCYILEDIHHFIGDKNGIGPTIGEIRSLIKELYRALQNRNEQVFFFVPAAYEWPPELAAFLEITDAAPDTQRRHSKLERYAKLMTSTEYINKLKPVIGSKVYIDRIIQTLAQKESNNPLLVGHPGVGKTALVEGFATALFRGNVPQNLRGRMLYNLSLNSLVAGTKYRGEMEARLEELIEEIFLQRNEIILFIDEIHGLFDAGRVQGGLGIGDILKPVLSRGEFPLIGATTFSGAEHLAGDSALARRFRPIVVDEPSPETTLKILRGVRPSFEQHHNIKIDDSALAAAVRLSSRASSGQYLPGRAISLIDSAAAYCRMKGEKIMREIDVSREVKGMDSPL